MGREQELLKAVKNNNFDKVERLYVPTRGSFIKKKERNFPSSLTLAQTSRKVKLDHIDVDVREEGTGYTPLMIAILNGCREIALSLVYHNADVNAQDSKGNTSLHLAVFKGRSDMMDLLMNCGCKISKFNLDGNTPLHVAVQNCVEGKLFMIFKLLQCGADPAATNKTGQAPLDLAAMFGKQEAASALIDHDPKLRQNTLAIVEASIRGKVKMVQALLDNGVDPNAINIQMGTGPLHEAVRYERTDVAATLLSYGADPFLKNAREETPESLAHSCPTQEKSAHFVTLFREFDDKPKATPRFVNMPEDEIDQAMGEKKYPVLRNDMKWTKDTCDFCSSCTAVNPNTNILDENPKTFWVIPAVSHSWTILDLRHEHALTGITIIGWDSPQMVKTIELQRATSKEGPWSRAGSFSCQRLGPSDPKEAGVPQDFHGFCVTSQYWRLMIIDNHGGPCICFQGINLFGVDTRVVKFFQNLHLTQYTDDFINQGYNQYSDLLNVKNIDLLSIVKQEVHREKTSLALKDLKLRTFPLTMLAWLRPPPVMATEGERLPALSVQADPEVSEELEILVNRHPPGIEGDRCIVRGQTRVALEPRGRREASVAVFENVELCTPGTFLIHVRCVRFPNRTVCAAIATEVVAAPKSNQEVAAAFDEIADMLADVSSSLDVSNDELDWQSPNENSINWKTPDKNRKM